MEDRIRREASELNSYKVFDEEQELSAFKEMVNWDSDFVAQIPEIPKVTKVVKLRHWVMAASAVAACLAFLMIYTPNETIEPVYDQAYINTIESTEFEKSVTLPDGTQACLSPNSSITFCSSFDDYNVRSCDITGMVTLDVAKDAEKPFIANVDYAQIKVLGTIFRVIANNMKIDVENLEGSVKFYAKGNEYEGVILEEGDRVRLTPSGGFEDLNEKVMPSYSLGYLLERIEKLTDGQIKAHKNLKVNRSQRLQVDLNSSLDELLEELDSKLRFEMMLGDCPDCFLITRFRKK